MADLEKQEKIVFHQHNIQHFDNSIKILNQQLHEAKDPGARENLWRNLLYARDAKQRELDAIAGIQSGQFVRTRTELDALNMQMMAEESRQLADKWHKIKRIMERGPRVIALAPEDEREDLQKFFNRHVTAENVVSGNEEKLSQAMQAIGDRVLGTLAREKEKHEDEAEYYDRRLEQAENVKNFCNNYMMCLSFAAGFAGGPALTLFGQPAFITASGAVYSTYGGIMGTLESGWQEGVSRFLGGFNAITTIVDEGMRGYQRGVLDHLEEYARNPEKVALDEEAAGF